MASFLQEKINRSLECIRWILQTLPWLFLATWLVFSPNALGQNAQALDIASENASQIRAQAFYFLDETGQFQLPQVLQADQQKRFSPLEKGLIFGLTPSQRLWLRLDIHRFKVAHESDDWSVWIPTPLIDEVVAYQQAGDKTWSNQRAGDRVAVDQWPEPGRYPRFHLDIPLGTTTVYLQIQNSTPITLPIHLSTEIQAQIADREGFLGMGFVIGLLSTLILFCWATAYNYHDRQYFLYGGYVLLLMLAVMSYTGLGAYLLWPSSPPFGRMLHKDYWRFWLWAERFISLKLFSQEGSSLLIMPN